MTIYCYLLLFIAIHYYSLLFFLIHSSQALLHCGGGAVATAASFGGRAPSLSFAKQSDSAAASSFFTGTERGHCCLAQRPRSLIPLSPNEASVAQSLPPLRGWSAATAAHLRGHATSPLSQDEAPVASGPPQSRGTEIGHYYFHLRPRALSPPSPSTKRQWPSGHLHPRDRSRPLLLSSAAPLTPPLWRQAKQQWPRVVPRRGDGVRPLLPPLSAALPPPPCRRAKR